MNQKIYKRVSSLIEEDRYLSDDYAFGSVLMKLEKNPSYLPSLKEIAAIAERCNCSADFVLGLSDSRDSTEHDIDASSFSANLKRFVAHHPTKFYLLKKQGFLDEFPSFYNWINGKFLPDAFSLARLARKLDISVNELLRKQTY